MMFDIIGAVVLVGLAFWFCRYVGGDPFGWAMEQIRAGWERIGKWPREESAITTR